MPDGRRLVLGTPDEKMVAVDIMVQDGNLRIGPPVPAAASYPGWERGACANLVVRAFRHAGID